MHENNLFYMNDAGKNVTEKTNVLFRAIKQEDNAVLANIIRGVMEEFKINKPGTIYFEPSTDILFELFQPAGSYYFVAGLNGEIAGGAGIFPTDQLPNDCCELAKMYLKPSARGKGIARELIRLCLLKAGELGYKKVYLESMFELKQAISLYEKFGFQYLSAPLGNSGHTSTDIWMIKSI